MTTLALESDVAIERLEVAAYEIPTDEPESDGTFEWRSTTIVVVEAEAGHEQGLGYTYGDAAAAGVIESTLAGEVLGCDALSPPATWARMQRRMRNAGRPGIAQTAISAIDVALWDLKAKLLEVPLADALPRFHESVPVYGSGGFTSYSRARLTEQLRGWVEEGISSVKVKVGRDPGADLARIGTAREAVGEDAELMVDANGAYRREQALAFAERFAELRVCWFEEPVSSDDLEGLRLVRDRAPAGMAIAAGEYAWGLDDLHALLSAGAVDVLQADVTRCGGLTSTIRADGVCRAHHVPFSAHGAPAISVHACCAMESAIHLEYFHDHARIERLLFEGTPTPVGGRLAPDSGRPGLGLELRRPDAARFAI